MCLYLSIAFEIINRFFFGCLTPYRFDRTAIVSCCAVFKKGYASISVLSFWKSPPWSERFLCSLNSTDLFTNKTQTSVHKHSTKSHKLIFVKKTLLMTSIVFTEIVPNSNIMPVFLQKYSRTSPQRTRFVLGCATFFIYLLLYLLKTSLLSLSHTNTQQDQNISIKQKTTETENNYTRYIVPSLATFYH